jgi:hypothetical protein
VEVLSYSHLLDFGHVPDLYHLLLLGAPGRELLVEQIEKTSRKETDHRESCDLYDRCGECPDFEDRFGIQAISHEVGGSP